MCLVECAESCPSLVGIRGLGNQPSFSYSINQLSKVATVLYVGGRSLLNRLNSVQGALGGISTIESLSLTGPISQSVRAEVELVIRRISISSIRFRPLCPEKFQNKRSVSKSTLEVTAELAL